MPRAGAMSGSALSVTVLGIVCSAWLGSVVFLLILLFLVAIILSIREQHAQNKPEYKKKTAEDAWISAVRGNLSSGKIITWRHKGNLEWVIDPLSDAYKQCGSRKAKCVFIGNAVEFKRYACEDPSSTDISEDVIPIVYLEPGHDFLFLPNVLDQPRPCLARSVRSTIRDKHGRWL
jgi:hypothetical protein